MSQSSEIEAARSARFAAKTAADRAERRVARAAELVLGQEMLPGPAPLPDFATLLAARARRQRFGWALGACGATASLVLVGALMLRERAPVSYVVAGGAARAGELIEADARTAATPARVHFSEGTEVALRPGARLRVLDRTAHGATLALDGGQAGFAVVHRSGARWSVTAGPFTVDVTGTEFTVDWSPRDERLVVDLAVGGVRVRGASVGWPVELHAGERLVATVADHRVTLSPVAEAKVAATDRGAVERSDARPPTPGVSAVSAFGVSATRASVMKVSSSSSTSSAPLGSGSLARPKRLVEKALPELALVSPGAIESPPPSPSLLAPSAAQAPKPLHLELAPRPVVTAIPQSLTLGGGGLFCVTVVAKYSFEQAVSPVALGISVPRAWTLAFSNPRIDHSHSWCGESSIRADARFDNAGRPNYFGRFANETGQLLIKLDHPTDFTDKTVTVHFFVEGPPDARFSAELAVVHHGGWVSGQPLERLTTGRWWTVSHRFAAENAAGVTGSSNPMPFPVGGRSPVSECDRLSLAIHSTGDRRVWTGAIYVDDITWK